jgi:hypothetical protein
MPKYSAAKLAKQANSTRKREKYSSDVLPLPGRTALTRSLIRESGADLALAFSLAMRDANIAILLLKDDDGLVPYKSGARKTPLQAFLDYTADEYAAVMARNVQSPDSLFDTILEQYDSYVREYQKPCHRLPGSQSGDRGPD